MSHQPFETWLLSEEPLEKDQQQSLQTHLAECDHCQALQTNWLKVQEAMTTLPAPEPTPGFADRWQSRLSLQRQKQQQRRMWVLTLSIFAIACVILLSLTCFELLNTSWPYVLSQFIANLSLLAAKINHFWRFTSSLTSTFPILIPLMIILGISALSALSVLFLTWFRSMIKLYKPENEGVIER